MPLEDFIEKSEINSKVNMEASSQELNKSGIHSLTVTRRCINRFDQCTLCHSKKSEILQYLLSKFHILKMKKVLKAGAICNDCFIEV